MDAFDTTRTARCIVLRGGINTEASVLSVRDDNRKGFNDGCYDLRAFNASPCI